VGLKLIPELSVFTLNQIMIFAQSAHLQQMAGKPLAKNEEDITRASYIRGILAGTGTPRGESGGGDRV
jgi:protein arginine kinase